MSSIIRTRNADIGVSLGLNVDRARLARPRPRDTPLVQLRDPQVPPPSAEPFVQQGIFFKEQGILAPEQGTRLRTNFLTLRMVAELPKKKEPMPAMPPGG